MDIAVALAISEETGKEPPFEAGVLDSVEYLRIDYARTLQGVSCCKNLEILHIVGCGPNGPGGSAVDLSPLQELGHLRTLVVKFCNLQDLAQVRAIGSLRRLDARMNRIEDLSPLLGMEIRSLLAGGNPLSEESYRSDVPELRNAGVRVGVSAEPVRQMNVELHRRGLPFGFYEAHDGTRVFRTGPSAELPDKSHPIISTNDLAALLDHPEHIADLFGRTDLMPTTFGR